MARTAVLAAMFPLTAVAGSHPASGAVGSESTIDLTVSVFNDARVPEKVVAGALDRAGYIFLRAGISVTWIDCGTPENRPAESGCSHISFPEHLSVRLVAGSSPATEDTFGQSFLNSEGEGSYANVYISALRSSSANAFLREGDLLGNVLAHEIGHLLLGPNSHSATGIMRAHWQPGELQMAAKGLLMFTAEQASRLHQRYRLAAARNRPHEQLEGVRSGR